MSDRIGPMAWGSGGQVFLGEDLMTRSEYSDETARVIDEEVERILREQEERCRQTLRPHRPGLDAVAEALLERETLDGAEVRRLIDAGAVPGTGPGAAAGGRGRRVGPRPPPACRATPTAGGLGGQFSAGGTEPGIAQLGHRRPQVRGRGRAHEARPHHPLGVGHHHRGDGVDGVATVDLRSGPHRHLVDGHVLRRQDSSLGRRPCAGVARLGREHRHQPRLARARRSPPGRAASAPPNGGRWARQAPAGRSRWRSRRPRRSPPRRSAAAPRRP
jgi:hypothetical protein